MPRRPSDSGRFFPLTDWLGAEALQRGSLEQVERPEAQMSQLRSEGRAQAMSRGAGREAWRAYLAIALGACALMWACDSGGDPSAEECVPTFGDHCDCDPKCMSQDELDAILRGGVCDLDCGDPDWSCDVEAGECTVVSE
ncbi:MAG: hypothetical protein EXR71_16860 [Myxococcales bacterium]|nr:hypothetical protein [Myxococcales bacterium]